MAGCGTGTPREPGYPVAARVWRFDGEEHQELAVPVVGQFRYPVGGACGGGEVWPYFHFPQTGPPLFSPQVLGIGEGSPHRDIIGFTDSLGGLYLYWVADVGPVALGYDNEHWSARLNVVLESPPNVPSPTGGAVTPMLCDGKPLPDAWDTEHFVVTTGTCEDCNDLTGFYRLERVGLEWLSEPFNSACSPAPLRFRGYPVEPSSYELVLETAEPTPENWATWRASCEEWSGGDTLACGLVSGVGDCSWPSTVHLFIG